MIIKVRDDRHPRSLTGLTRKQLDIPLETFTLIFETSRQRSYQEGVSAGTRGRCPGGDFGGNKILKIGSDGSVSP